MKVGEKFKIPEEICGHNGRVVGMSTDGKSIYVKSFHSKTIWKYKGLERWKLCLDTYKEKRYSLHY